MGGSLCKLTILSLSQLQMWPPHACALLVHHTVNTQTMLASLSQTSPSLESEDKISVMHQFLTKAMDGAEWFVLLLFHL